NHQGNFTAAAAELRGKGFGRPPLTDVGNAQRLVAQFGNQMKWLEAEKNWLIWTGKRWAPDQTLRAMALAKETTRLILQEAADCSELEERKSIAAWATKSQDARRIEAMLRLAKP